MKEDSVTTCQNIMHISYQGGLYLDYQVEASVKLRHNHFNTKNKTEVWSEKEQSSIETSDKIWWKYTELNITMMDKSKANNKPKAPLPMFLQHFTLKEVQGKP
jgi:hypothetical protein